MEYFEAGIVEALIKLDEVKDVDDDAVADLKNFVGGGANICWPLAVTGHLVIGDIILALVLSQ